MSQIIESKVVSTKTLIESKRISASAKRLAKALLARGVESVNLSFAKANGFEQLIISAVEKGGSGSGAQGGHEFYGNGRGEEAAKPADDSKAAEVKTVGGSTVAGSNPADSLTAAGQQANNLTEIANQTGSSEDHQNAADAHQAEADAQSDRADSATNPVDAAEARDLMEQHQAAAEEHSAMANAGTAQEAEAASSTSDTANGNAGSSVDKPEGEFVSRGDRWVSSGDVTPSSTVTPVVGSTVGSTNPTDSLTDEGQQANNLTAIANETNGMEDHLNAADAHQAEADAQSERAASASNPVIYAEARDLADQHQAAADGHVLAAGKQSNPDLDYK